MVIRTTLENISHDLSIVKEVLLGNGDPEKSVLIRLTRLEDRVISYHAAAEQKNKGIKSNRTNRAMIICSLVAAAAAILVALIK